MHIDMNSMNVYINHLWQTYLCTRSFPFTQPIISPPLYFECALIYCWYYFKEHLPQFPIHELSFRIKGEKSIKPGYLSPFFINRIQSSARAIHFWWARYYSKHKCGIDFNFYIAIYYFSHLVTKPWVAIFHNQALNSVR